MKRAKFIIGLQIAFLIGMLTFSGAMGYHNTGMPSTTTMLKSELGLEIDTNPAAYKRLTAQMEFLADSLKKLRAGEVPEGFRELGRVKGQKAHGVTVEGLNLALLPTGEIVEVKVIPESLEGQVGIIKASSAGMLSPMEIEALAEGIPELLEPLKAGQVAQANDILAKLEEREGRPLPSLVRVGDVEDKPTHAAVIRTEKGYLPVSVTTGLTEVFKDRQAQYFNVRDEIIAVAVLRELPPEVLPYLAIAPQPEEAPLWAAWINIPELKQAYKTPQALRTAAQYALTSYTGVLPLFARKAVTEKALGMLQEVRERAGLPFKSEGLGYLAEQGREGLFRNWPDFYAYFSKVEFETPITQLNEYGKFENISMSVEPKKGEVRTAENLAPAMRNPEAVKALGEAPISYTISGLFRTPEQAEQAYEQEKIRYDITVIPPAMLGEEPARTKGHYHRPIAMPEIYQPLVGEAWYLLQRPKKYLAAETTEELTQIEEVILVKAEAGEFVVIPPGWGYISINPSPEKPLIMANWVTTEQEFNAVPYVESQGGAYHVIWQKGEPKLVSNPQYGEVPEVRQAKPIMEIPHLGLEAGEPISEVVENLLQLRALADFLIIPESSEGIIFAEVFNPVEKPFVEKIAPVTPSKGGMKASSAGQPVTLLLTSAQGVLRSPAIEESVSRPILSHFEISETHFRAAFEAETQEEAIRQLEKAQAELREGAKAVEEITGKAPKTRETLLPLAKETEGVAKIMEMATLAIPAEIEQEINATIIWDDTGLPKGELALLSKTHKLGLNKQLRESLAANVTLLSELDDSEITENTIIVTNRDISNVVKQDSRLEDIGEKLESMKVNYKGGLLPLSLLNIGAKAKLIYNIDKTHYIAVLLRETFKRLTGVSLDDVGQIYAAGYIIDLLPGVMPVDNTQRDEFHRIDLMTVICV